MRINQKYLTIIYLKGKRRNLQNFLKVTVKEIRNNDNYDEILSPIMSIPNKRGSLNKVLKEKYILISDRKYVTDNSLNRMSISDMNERDDKIEIGIKGKSCKKSKTVILNQVYKSMRSDKSHLNSNSNSHLSSLKKENKEETKRNSHVNNYSNSNHTLNSIDFINKSENRELTTNQTNRISNRNLIESISLLPQINNQISTLNLLKHNDKTGEMGNYSINYINGLTSSLKNIPKREIHKFDNIDDSASDDEFTNLTHSSRFIFLHSNRFIYLWMLFSYWINIYISSYYIYEYAYMLDINSLSTLFNSDSSINSLKIKTTFDVFLLFDVFVNFNTSFLNANENLICIRRNICLRYLKSYFTFDVITSFPYFYILYIIYKFIIDTDNDNDNAYAYSYGNDYSNNNSYITYVSYKHFSNENIKLYLLIIYILKYLRIGKVIQYNYSKEYEDGINKNSIMLKWMKFKNVLILNKFSNLIMFLFILIHLFSCVWMIIAKLEYINLIEITWIEYSQISGYDGLYSKLYLDSLYFSMTTLLTVGYGDIKPKTFWEIFILLVYILIGSLYYSFILSSISQTVQSNNLKSLQLKKKQKLLSKLKLEYSISNKLMTRLNENINHAYGKSDIDIISFLEDLPYSLKNSLYLIIFNDKVKDLSFFKNSISDFIIYTIPFLKKVKFLEKEEVISFGDYFEEMFILLEGTISIRLGYKFLSFEINEIKKNSHFGDIYLYTNQASNYSLITKSKTIELYSISKEVFLNLKLLFKYEIEFIIHDSYIVFMRLETLRKEAILFYSKNENFDGFDLNTKRNVFDPLFVIERRSKVNRNNDSNSNVNLNINIENKNISGIGKVHNKRKSLLNDMNDLKFERSINENVNKINNDNLILKNDILYNFTGDSEKKSKIFSKSMHLSRKNSKVLYEKKKSIKREFNKVLRVINSSKEIIRLNNSQKNIINHVINKEIGSIFKKRLKKSKTLQNKSVQIDSQFDFEKKTLINNKLDEKLRKLSVFINDPIDNIYFPRKNFFNKKI